MPQSDKYIIYDQIVVFIIIFMYIYYIFLSEVSPKFFQSSFAIAKANAVLRDSNVVLSNRVVLLSIARARKINLSLDTTQARIFDSPRYD